MSLNLHAIVRPLINAVNADIPAQWLVSTGSTTAADGSLTPTYAPAKSVLCQVQPPSGKALQHTEFLNLQGSTRSVYMYGYPQAIDRVEAKGGDLLLFAQVPGAPVNTWLIVAQEEAGWSLPRGGWSKVTVVLQVNGP